MIDLAVVVDEEVAQAGSVAKSIGQVAVDLANTLSASTKAALCQAVADACRGLLAQWLGVEELDQCPRLVAHTGARVPIDQQLAVSPRAVPEQGRGVVENDQVDGRPAERSLRACSELQPQLEALSAAQSWSGPHGQVDI